MVKKNYNKNKEVCYKSSDKLFRCKLKIRFFKKNIIKIVKLYFGLPHIWILIIILFLAVLCLILSFYLKDIDSFRSSIYANIFAGLLTGIIIYLISTIKGMYLYKLQSKINWLSELHEMCLDFLKTSKEICFSKKLCSYSTQERCNRVYDLVSLGNDISAYISQGQFNESLPFNTYKFCKKKMNFDSVEQEKANSELREKNLVLDYDKLNNSEIRDLFNDMDRSIRNLNSGILKKSSI